MTGTDTSRSPAPAAASTGAKPDERRCLVCDKPIGHLKASAKVCGGSCRAELSRRNRGCAVKRPEDPRCARCGGKIVGRNAQALYCGSICSRAAAADRAAARAASADTDTAGAQTPAGSAAGVAITPGQDPACSQASHRPHDWITTDGRVVCGLCDPPASSDLIAGWVDPAARAAAVALLRRRLVNGRRR
jgi:hypothetical protein